MLFEYIKSSMNSEESQYDLLMKQINKSQFLIFSEVVQKKIQFLKF